MIDVAEEMQPRFEAMVRDMRDQVRDLVNKSGPMSDEDLSVLISAVEQADLQQIELHRTYVRALSTEGLYSAARVAAMLQLALWNEMLGRLQTQQFLQKEVLDKK